MSGPKTSRYTLSAEQRRNLNAQNQCDSNILACISQVKSLFTQIAPALSGIELFETCGNDDNLAKTQQLKDALKSIETKKIELKSEFSKVSYYERPVSRLLTQSELERKKNILKNVQGIKKDTENILSKIKEIKSDSDKLHNSISNELEKNLENSFDLSWDWKEDETHKESKNETIVQALCELLEMGLSASLELKVKTAIEKAKTIENDDFLHNFKAVTLNPLAAECKHYVEIKEIYGEKFNELNLRYISLCEMLGMKHSIFTLSEEGCTQLEKEIAILEEELLNADEQEYIADAIDEVMEEMGYDLIGSREVTKKSGKRFRDELYTFSEGTAVNIRYDNQGKIAMELGGIDSTDRLPSSSEASRLEDEMVAFCDKFTEFEKRLAAKGIVCKNSVSHLPPKAEYAQIINTSDYDMKTDVETFKAERRSSKGESKKQHRNE